MREWDCVSVSPLLLTGTLLVLTMPLVTYWVGGTRALHLLSTPDCSTSGVVQLGAGGEWLPGIHNYWVTYCEPYTWERGKRTTVNWVLLVSVSVRPRCVLDPEL